jgi:2Fe-2S ferredoxin
MNIYKITVTDLDGKTHVLDAPEGYRIMEIIRDNDLPIKAECGGCCSCATCHVYVSEEWVDKLVQPLAEELEMLDDAFFVEDNSRLSCQIIMRAEFDGLQVTIAPGND